MRLERAERVSVRRRHRLGIQDRAADLQRTGRAVRDDVNAGNAIFATERVGHLLHAIAAAVDEDDPNTFRNRTHDSRQIVETRINERDLASFCREVVRGDKSVEQNPNLPVGIQPRSGYPAVTIKCVLRSRRRDDIRRCA